MIVRRTGQRKPKMTCWLGSSTADFIAQSRRAVDDLLFPSVVVNVVVTVSSLQVLLRRKRHLELRGPTHLSHSSRPGAISVKGFPNTLIQVNHWCESHRSQREQKPNTMGGGGGVSLKHWLLFTKIQKRSLTHRFNHDIREEHLL